MTIDVRVHVGQDLHGHLSTDDELLDAAATCSTGDPLLRPERWIRDSERLDIRDEVRPLVMEHDAIRALGLQR